MRYWLHRLAHVLDWNHGWPDTKWNDHGQLVVFFRCECGEESGHHVTSLRRCGLCHMPASPTGAGHDATRTHEL